MPPANVESPLSRRVENGIVQADGEQDGTPVRLFLFDSLAEFVAYPRPLDRIGREDEDELGAAGRAADGLYARLNRQAMKKKNFRPINPVPVRRSA